MTSSTLLMMLSKDDLGHVIKFIALDDKPASIRGTCRYFSNEIDMEFVLQKCCLEDKPIRPWNSQDFFETMKEKIRKLYLNQERGFPSPLFLITLLYERLASCSNEVAKRETKDFLKMAIINNDTESVKYMLKQGDRCSIEGQFELDKALLQGSMDVAAILQENPKVKQSIRLCSACNKNPSCVKCLGFLNDDIECADPNGGRKKFCRNCTVCDSHATICSVCEQHQCQQCRDTWSDVYEYYPCRTCGKIACGFEDPINGNPPCFQKCHNNENLCGNIQCNSCASEDCRLRWYKCDNDHAFCEDCQPQFVKYDVVVLTQIGDGNNSNNIRNCPACLRDGGELVRRCWNYDICGTRLELDTVEYDGWYKCEDNPNHWFCPACHPKNGQYDEDIDENNYDTDRCLACQGLDCGG